jgi:DNA-binding CsgD family transcriptional regulator
VHEQTRSGPWILSALTAEHPEMLETWRSHFDGAQDAVGVIALDTDGYGIQILAPSPKVVRLSHVETNRWRMLAAHLASGLRLRRALSTERDRRDSCELPHGAEAVITPSDFQVADAAEGARNRNTLQLLREAAIRIDRARSKEEREDSAGHALESWRALVRGRHSMVDWFDTDGRRYILAIPNPPNVVDVRGLNEMETAVTQYAALGDNHKLIAYRLGIHRTTVTKALRTAMRKLGVKTQAELVAKIKPLIDASGRQPEEPAM